MQKLFSVLLANTVLMQLKTQIFHWNVVGDDFFDLHKFFNTLYDFYFEKSDVLAERLRSLGELTPKSAFEFFDKSTLSNLKNLEDRDAKTMVKEIIHDQEIYLTLCKKVFKEAKNDDVTQDILTQITADIEKFQWMARSYLS